MIFKCQNCGGNVVYSPERHSMYCPYCDSEESQEIQRSTNAEMDICPDCGGQIPVWEHTSATQCPYCNNYLIFDERIEGEYLPKRIIPFQLGKEKCKQSMRDKFRKITCIPTDFLSEVSLNKMEGTYVPFWFFDYDVNVDFQGEGTKVKTWTSGDTRYTETSYFDIRRNVDIDFCDIPVDASVQMPDDIMDLMEPYNYTQLINFDPKFMSGFYSEKYNMTADVVESRAKKKMTDDSNALVKETYSGYNNVRQQRSDISIRRAVQSYGLLPVWRYIYRYKDEYYPFYINGQTGKIVGKMPISIPKVLAYSATIWACLMAILSCVGFGLMSIY